MSQYIEYMPFGEMLVDEHINSFNTPFKFNGKELDEETGNYYYGARYYDPKWSMFIGVDPLAEKYPEWSSYAYCYNNPIRYIDPTGMEGVEDGITSKEPKLNIIVTIRDLNTDGPIIPETWDTEAWHHITVDDVSEANTIIKEYLGGKKANNIVLNSHGGIVNNSKQHFIQTGVEHELMTEDFDRYKEGAVESKEFYRQIDVKGVNDLKTLSSFVKNEGNFVVFSCTAGDDPIIGSKMSEITNKRINLFFISGLCHIRTVVNDDPKNIYRDTRYIFQNSIKGTWHKYSSGTGQKSIIKSIELMQSDKNNPIKIK